jgi:hypothetical protein
MNVRNLAYLITSFVALFTALSTHAAQIQIDNPKDHIVFQRNNSGWAYVQVKGSYLNTAIALGNAPISVAGVGNGGVSAGGGATPPALSSVECRFTPVQPSWGTAVNWTSIPVSGPTFNGQVQVQGGWYTMDIRIYVGGQLTASTTVSRVGVGEVFGVTGHSNAQGGHSPSVACADERVISINKTFTDGIWVTQSNWNYSSINTSSNAIAPFGPAPWCWGPMGDALVTNLNVPVLFYSAAFGGTSSEHWSKAANAEHFEHSFVRWDWQMPYTNLQTIVKTMAKRTGIRAILVLHGENDSAFNQQQTVDNQTNYFWHARYESGMTNLAFILGHSLGSHNIARTQNEVDNNKDYLAQNQMISTVPHVYHGPQIWQKDGDASQFHADFLHYSTLGTVTFGQMWAGSITPSFLSSSVPYLATFQ